MALPTTQKGLIVHALRSPLTLVTNRPIIQPTANQILIRVSVAGINPHDQKSRDLGLFIADKLPAVLTNDVVGRVVSVGDSVTNFKEGDRVVTQAGWAPGNPSNGLQEYATLEADFVSKIPDGVSDDEAATIPTNALPALVAFYGPKGFQWPAPWSTPKADLSGESLLIIGGGSNCGRFAVQLAALGGVGTIVVLGGNEAELKSYGATHVLDRSGSHEGVAARIQHALPNGTKSVFDAINPPETQYVGINVLSAGGKYARLLPLGPPDTKHITSTEYEVANVFGSSHAVPEVSKEFWARLPGYLERGEIKPTEFTVVKGLTAESVDKVLNAYRDGKRVVKTHVHIS